MNCSGRHRKCKLRILAWLSAVLLTVFFIPTTGTISAESSGSYELSAELADGSIEMKLTNTSEEQITLKGPVDVRATVKEYDLNFSRETLSTAAGDVILGGETSMTIAAGGTDTIAVIAPGLPDTWRPNESSNHILEIELWLEINDLDTNVGTAEVQINPVDIDGLELVLNSPVPYEEGTPPNIEISLKNTSGSSVTINGPVVVQGLGHWSLEPGGERQRFNLLGEVTSIPIPAGETVKVAEVEPGAPYSWRNLYFPKTLPITVWVEVAGHGVWQSEMLIFAITGEYVYSALDGEVTKVENNEDGTASIYVEVNRGSESFTAVTEQSDGSFKTEHITNDYSDEPVTGLTKDNFGVWPKGPEGAFTEFMDIQRVFETSPGVYRIIVSDTDGTYRNIVVETNTETGVPHGLFADDLTFTISTLNRPVDSVKDTTTDKYVGTLSYPSINMTFTSDQEVTATINLRQKNATARPIPEEDYTPSGLFFDINVAEGELIDTEILLEITYTRDDIPAGMNESNLKIFRYNETSEAWDLLPNQEIDTEKKVISVLLTGFSEFGLFEYEGLIPEDEEETEPVTEEEVVENPQTGDTNNRSAMIALILVLASSMTLLAAKPWKKETVE